MAASTSFTSFAPFKAPEGSEAEVLVIALALAYESVSSGNIAPVVAWVDKVLDLPKKPGEEKPEKKPKKGKGGKGKKKKKK